MKLSSTDQSTEIHDTLVTTKAMDDAVTTLVAVGVEIENDLVADSVRRVRVEDVLDVVPC